jgi:hypothetical protein
MTALVRAFGYKDLPVLDTRQRIRPLVELYGEQARLAANEEIIEVDNSVEPSVRTCSSFQTIAPLLTSNRSE